MTSFLRVYLWHWGSLTDEEQQRTQQRLATELPASDQDDLQQFGSENKKAEFIFSRALLYSVYSQHLKVTDVGEVLFTDSGKPYFKDSYPFSLSHSSGYSVVAVASSGQVGVDIDGPSSAKGGRKRNVRAIIEAYGNDSEREKFAAMTDEVAEEEFYRLWSLKESFGKATGHGLTEDLRNINFLADGTVEGSSRPGKYHHEVVEGCHVALTYLGDEALSPEVIVKSWWNL